jgi:hypothetical protein
MEVSPFVQVSAGRVHEISRTAPGSPGNRLHLRCDHTMFDSTSIRDAPPARVERWEAIVIGAGDAGIALGRLLLERDVDFVLLDRHTAPRGERRAKRHELPLRTSCDVRALRWNGRHYLLNSPALCFEASHVIVATGCRTCDWRWIHLELQIAEGLPCTLCGIVPTHPGLYFAGRFADRLGLNARRMRTLRHTLIAECIASEQE